MIEEDEERTWSKTQSLNDTKYQSASDSGEICVRFPHVQKATNIGKRLAAMIVYLNPRDIIFGHQEEASLKAQNPPKSATVVSVRPAVLK